MPGRATPTHFFKKNQDVKSATPTHLDRIHRTNDNIYQWAGVLGLYTIMCRQSFADHLYIAQRGHKLAIDDMVLSKPSATLKI